VSAAVARRTMAATATALTLLVAAVACGAEPASVSAQPLELKLPSVGVSLLGGVSVGSAEVAVPGVSVSTPAVTVSTPSATVSTPGVTVGGSDTGTSPQPPVTTTSTPTTGATTTVPAQAPVGGGSSGSSTDPRYATESPAGASAASAGSGRTASAPRSGSSASSGGPLRARRSDAQRHRRGGGVAAGSRRTAASAASPGGATVLAPAAAPPRGANRGSSNPLEALGKQLPLPLPVPDWSKPIILALLALALAFGVRSRFAVRRARRLERQRETLLRDVDAMQAALVPSVPARVGGLAVSVGYRPADGPAAGGDFYDVFALGRGKVAIVLGDVAGHGPQALTQAALTRYTVRAYLQTGLEPRAALALAGRVLADRKAEHFATVAVGVYDVHDGRLTYACAGHPQPIMHGLQTRGPLMACAAPPIGWTVPTGCRQTTVSLPRGAVVCFFSDGLVEARCKDGLLGRERLSLLVDSLGKRDDAGDLLRRVRDAAEATPDDMAACIVAPHVTVVAAPTQVEEFEVDAGALARGRARVFLETCQVPAQELDRALDRAGELVAVFGGALLSAELSSTSATVEVNAPSTAPAPAVVNA
jgi:Stage II sporulation protein E (SpoIIE)